MDDYTAPLWCMSVCSAAGGPPAGRRDCAYGWCQNSHKCTAIIECRATPYTSHPFLFIESSNPIGQDRHMWANGIIALQHPSHVACHVLSFPLHHKDHRHTNTAALCSRGRKQEKGGARSFSLLLPTSRKSSGYMNVWMYEFSLHSVTLLNVNDKPGSQLGGHASFWRMSNGGPFTKVL